MCVAIPTSPGKFYFLNLLGYKKQNVPRDRVSEYMQAIPVGVGGFDPVWCIWCFSCLSALTSQLDT